MVLNLTVISLSGDLSGWVSFNPARHIDRLRRELGKFYEFLKRCCEHRCRLIAAQFATLLRVKRSVEINFEYLIVERFPRRARPRPRARLHGLVLLSITIPNQP